jgi:hypothetical protein
MAAGDDVMLFWRNLGSPHIITTVRVRRDDAHGDFEVPELERDIGIGYMHPEMGKIGIEQLYTRYDPRHDRTLLTWQWFDVEDHRFGSNPFLYSDDHAETWRRADGSIMEKLPVSYGEIDPVLVPVDHLAGRRDVNWHPRDIGVSPGGVGWMTLPRGWPYETGAWHLRLLRFADGAWSNQPLTGPLYGGCKPHAVGVTRDRMVLLYAEAAEPNVLKARFSADDGATWSSPVVVEALPGEGGTDATAVSWVSFAQPTEEYDDAARFFYAYFREADGDWGRNYLNSVGWVRIDLGPACGADYNGDGELNVLDFIAFETLWRDRDPAADCDGGGSFDVLDFVCFQLEFAEGCD